MEIEPIGPVRGGRAVVEDDDWGAIDAVDGTSVVDIKPVMTAFLPREAVREPGGAGELMAEYWARPTEQ